MTFLRWRTRSILLREASRPRAVLPKGREKDLTHESRSLPNAVIYRRVPSV